MYYPTPISQLPSHYLYVYAFPCTLLISLTKYDIHLPPLMWLETHSYHSLVRLHNMMPSDSCIQRGPCQVINPVHISHTPVGTSRLFGYKFIWISRSLVDRGCVNDVTPINVALRNTMKPLVSSHGGIVQPQNAICFSVCKTNKRWIQKEIVTSFVSIGRYVESNLGDKGWGIVRKRRKSISNRCRCGTRWRCEIRNTGGNGDYKRRKYKRINLIKAVIAIRRRRTAVPLSQSLERRNGRGYSWR